MVVFPVNVLLVTEREAVTPALAIPNKVVDVPDVELDEIVLLLIDILAGVPLL